MKKISSAILAFILLISLFSGCSAGEYETTPPTADFGPAYDAPTEVPHITLFGVDYTNSLNGDFLEAAEALDKLLYEEYGIAVDRTIVTGENVRNVLNSRVAAGTIADCYISGGFLPDLNITSYIDEGKFMPIDEVLKYSDGTSSALFGKNGVYEQLRARTVYSDGNMYEILMPRLHGASIDISNGKYLTNYAVNCWYTLNIRADWLKKLSLDMPETPDEFCNALKAFQDNDMNGNGKPDERAYIGLGKSNYVFANGVAGWYGLPRGNFVQDNATGEVVNAIEAEGYRSYISYAKRLFDEQLSYMNDNVFDSYLTDLASNNASVYLAYPDVLSIVSTGDADASYVPVPIIQALPSVAPHVVTNKDRVHDAEVYGISFRADADPEICAKFLDFISGESFYMTMEYGEKGVAWDYIDGKAKLLDPSKDTIGPRKNCMMWTGYPVIDTSEVYGEKAVVYNGIADALQKGEPYAANGSSYDEWKSSHKEDKSNLHSFLDSLVNFGEDKIVFETDCDAFGFPTSDEYDAVVKYEAALETYFNELTSGYITGNRSLDTYDDDIAEAYDSYGLGEFMAALQAKSDRFMKELSR